MRNVSVLERLLSKVSVPVSGGCWLWEGGKTSEGYGSMWYGERRRSAHRTAYELSKGEIPKGLDLDHLCRVRHCVNPQHLEAVNRRENCRRGDCGKHNKVKTHCKNGHPYSGDNIIVRKRRTGGRDCRECNREQARKRRQLCGN